MRMRHRTTRTQRVGIRRVGGPLKTVLDKTKNLYDVSLKLFCSWCAANDTWPDSKQELDHAACQFLMHCWQEGKTRAVGANLLSGIGNTEPSLKWHLAGTRRRYAAWVKRELCARCCPATWSMAEAIAGILSWEEGAMVLLLHHGLLRTMEVLNSRCGDFIFQLPLLKDHLSLPDTRTRKRHGRSESVSLCDAKVVKLLSMLCESRQPETECTLAAQQHSASNLDWLCQLWAGQTWTSKSSQCATMAQQTFSRKPTACRTFVQRPISQLRD